MGLGEERERHGVFVRTANFASRRQTEERDQKGCSGAGQARQRKILAGKLI